MLRFADELIARVERAGASGVKLLRADSAFWNKKLIARLQQTGWQYSISVRLQFWVQDAVTAIPETDWQPLSDYPEDGEAQIAETMLGRQATVVRRTRLVGAQAELWPDWRYFPFLTNRTEPLELVEAEHRQHAVVELTIRDLKDQALAHFPSGQFNANSAWTVIACLAHNLTRWTTVIGLPDHDHPLRPHPPPPAAADPRAADPHSPNVDAAPPRPLALATATSSARSPASALCPQLPDRHTLQRPLPNPSADPGANALARKHANLRPQSCSRLQPATPTTRSLTSIRLATPPGPSTRRGSGFRFRRTSSRHISRRRCGVP